MTGVAPQRSSGAEDAIEDGTTEETGLNQDNTNPLDLENKLYSIEEFGLAIRNKFGGDNYISNVIV